VQSNQGNLWSRTKRKRTFSWMFLFWASHILSLCCKHGIAQSKSSSMWYWYQTFGVWVFLFCFYWN